MSTSTVAPAISARGSGSLQRTGWTFAVSFLLFVVSVVLFSVDGDRFQAERDAADRLGVSVHELPGAVMSDIAREHASAVVELTSAAPSVLGVVLFAAATWRLSRGGGGMGRVSRATAATYVLLFVASLACFVALYAGPGRLPWIHDHFVVLVRTLIAASVVVGLASVIASAVLLRRRAVARRTGVVVAVIAGLAAVAAPVPAVGGMPPALPCLLAMVLGIVMIRSHEPG